MPEETEDADTDSRRTANGIKKATKPIGQIPVRLMVALKTHSLYVYKENRNQVALSALFL